MSNPITIIGSETIVSGNLEGDEDLTVEGRVEGSISLSKTLTVEVGGVVRADINVRNAVISGVLVGNVEAQESVHITEQGRVVGDISAPRVILVDGSSFKGNIDMGDFNIDQVSSERKETKTRKPTVPSARVRPAVPAKVAEAVDEKVDDTTAVEVEAEDVPPVTRVRRAIPVRTTGSSDKAPAVHLSGSKGEKKQPPAPRVRVIGKKTKAKKKKA